MCLLFCFVCFFFGLFTILVKALCFSFFLCLIYDCIISLSQKIKNKKWMALYQALKVVVLVVEIKFFGLFSCIEFFWGIWKERDSRIFEEKGRNFHEVVDSIIREVGSCLMTTKEFAKLSLSPFYRDWTTSISIQPTRVRKVSMGWQPPTSSVVKINFDGSFKRNLGLAGFGFVIRDHNSNILMVICGSLVFAIL